MSSTLAAPRACRGSEAEPRPPHSGLSATEAGGSRLARPLEEFKTTVVEADRAALKAGGLPDEVASQLSAAVTALPTLVTDVLADADTPQEAATLRARTQAELLPYLLPSRNAERWYAKPRGYAGDFLSIAWIYNNQPAGVGRIGPAVDRGFLQVSACRAVYNRRRLLAEEIGRSCPGNPTGRYGSPAWRATVANCPLWTRAWCTRLA